MATDLCEVKHSNEKVVSAHAASTSRAPTTKLREHGRHWCVLVLILAGNFLVRHEFERWTHHSYSEIAGVSLIDSVRHKPYRALLPIDTGGGQTWWVTSSLLVLELLDRTLTPRYTFIVLNLLTILVSFWTSWHALRSRVFTYTFTIGMAFGTHLHYSFALSGTFVLYLQVIYLEVILLCLYRIVQGTGNQLLWRVGYVGALAVFAIGFDTWYNFLLYLCLACPFLYLFFRWRGQTEYYPRIRFVIITAFLIACVHIPVKLAYAKQHFTPGKEDELIFVYQEPALIIEDFVSNVITYTYMSLMNYTPPFLLTSNSHYALKDEGILREQHGYHAQYSHLVVTHHHFLWHFYAGIVFAIFAWGLYRSLVGVFRDQSTIHLAFALILLGVLCGAGTHVLIKFRPYMSVPSLTYKCMPGVLATTVLLSYGLMRLRDRFRSPKLYASIVALAWCVIIYGGFTRPSRLSHLNTSVGLGTYPDPIQGAKQWSRQLLHGKMGGEK
jgi:hypothetical protein